MAISGLLLLAVSAAMLQTDSTLRTGCESDDSEIAALPAGTAVEVRSALSGSAGTCYKVAAVMDGKAVSGYVAARSLKGVESFDQARRSGGNMSASGGPSRDLVAVARTIAKGASSGSPVAERIQGLIAGNQPAEALELAEAELKKTPRNPLLLALAGLACYRLDHLDKAIDYWNDSLEGEANPSVSALRQQAQRERKADSGSERLVGARVLVRYERSTVPPALANVMLGVLEEEYSRISAQLGCRASERVTAILQSRDSYYQSTGAAEWSGGQYDGRIHVPVSTSSRVDGETRKTFAHELVHACLSEMGQWPAWLQEGLAQKYSGDRLNAQVTAQLQAMIKAGQVPKLNQLGQTFSRMSSVHAQVAYSIALLAADKLLQLTANTGIQNVVRNPAEFERMTAEVEKSLGL